MTEKLTISATIVLYNEDVETLQKTIDCFLEIPLGKKLFLVDNSSTDILKDQFNHPEITYIFVGENKGFGKGHNLVMGQLRQLSKYHLILNPDIVFNPQVIPNLIRELENNQSIAMISPKVVYPDGALQFTCRMHPTVLELISRRLGVHKQYVQKKSYRNLDLSKPFYPEFIHGCFLLFNTNDFIQINGFDERYFLYMEDADICRKIAEIGKRILYLPKEAVEHLHRRESATSVNLFLIHMSSAFKYFKKWGF
ncbi:MAG: glycosyltransferase family 2 protein [Flavobacteriaceae bacterium]|nr:glycosyltransferase family 2 protein [Flavobacteriaceae bacterium]